MSHATPDTIAQVARQHDCKSVAFTYNDPVIFHEYALDTAQACRELGVNTVAVSAGYVCAEPRAEFYRCMDAVNIDLKAFREDFYWKLTGAHLEPVLDTLRYIYHHTQTWLEITTLIIPGHNDNEAELRELAQWVASELGPEVPLHFSAFHPDFKMLDVPSTPLATLQRARVIAREEGLQHVYTGNVHDTEGDVTYCSHCQALLIQRDWYEITAWHLGELGRCPECATILPGKFDPMPGRWGRRRQSLAL
jgi:pyruvate formate lyase activating enzyme